MNHFLKYTYPENIKYAYEFQKLAANQFMWVGEKQQ